MKAQLIINTETSMLFSENLDIVPPTPSTSSSGCGAITRTFLGFFNISQQLLELAMVLLRLQAHYNFFLIFQ